MRKFVMSLVMVLFMAGLVCAVEATLVKGDADKKEVVVKEGDKENTYKYTDKLKVTLIVDKDGNTKEGKLSDFTAPFQGRARARARAAPSSTSPSTRTPSPRSSSARAARRRTDARAGSMLAKPGGPAGLLHFGALLKRLGRSPTAPPRQSRRN